MMLRGHDQEVSQTPGMRLPAVTMRAVASSYRHVTEVCKHYDDETHEWTGGYHLQAFNRCF